MEFLFIDIVNVAQGACFLLSDCGTECLCRSLNFALYNKNFYCPVSSGFKR